MVRPFRRGFSKIPLIAAGLFFLVLTILPGHAIARCFGVPEGLGDESGVDAWFMRLRVEAATGFAEQVTFGFHPKATDGFDRGYDQFAQPPDFRPGGEEFELVTYFSYLRTTRNPGGFPKMNRRRPVCASAPSSPAWTWRAP